MLTSEFFVMSKMSKSKNIPVKNYKISCVCGDSSITNRFVTVTMLYSDPSKLLPRSAGLDPAVIRPSFTKPTMRRCSLSVHPQRRS